MNDLNDYGYGMAARSYEALTELDGVKVAVSDAEPAAYCDACGSPLYSGDFCYSIGNDVYCESCCHAEVV
jgi:hypothetical protein